MKPSVFQPVRRMTNNPPRLIDWQAEARRRLDSALERPDTGWGLEIQVLAACVLGQTRAWVLGHPEHLLLPDQVARLEALVEKLAQGTPLPYLTGRQEFYGLEFEVTPEVLIPRPETELLVEHALAAAKNLPGGAWAADVGTGSGCIAVTLAKHAPNLCLLAVDRSRAALYVARRNAVWHVVAERVHFVQGSLLTAARGPFSLVCANLPYIPAGALADLETAKHEPRMALDGGTDGLALIAALLADAPRILAPGGLMLLEMQYDQGPAIHALTVGVLPGVRVSVLPDLAGLPRLVKIEQRKEK